MMNFATQSPVFVSDTTQGMRAHTHTASNLQT